MPTCILKWERLTFKPLFSEYLIILMKWKTPSQEGCRREVGYPKSNQQPVAQTTLTEDLKLVQFVLRALVSKNSWHSLIASPGCNSQISLYFDLK